MECLKAGALETLILYENLDIYRVVLKNTETGEEKIIFCKPADLHKNETEGIFKIIKWFTTLSLNHLQ